MAGLWKYYPAVSGGDWEDEVPPRVNADGSIDYVLMQKSKNVEGHYWVMRLPKEISVRRSQNRNLGQFSTGGISAGLRETANSYITVYFYKDSLRPAVLEDKLSLDDTLALDNFFEAHFENYYEFDDGPDSNIRDNFEACHEELSSSSRVRIFSYDEELEKAHKPKQCHVRPFAHEDWTTKSYVIANIDRKFIGDIRCVTYPKELKKKCSGLISLGHNNHVLLNVYTDQIDLQKLVLFVDTVRDFATQNMLARGALAVGHKYKF